MNEPTFYGLLRVKNEARWIGRVLKSLKPLCEVIFLFDDHSTDDTREIAKQAGAEVFLSPFRGVDETRDKNYLIKRLHGLVGPFSGELDWALMIDGDEVLEPGSAEQIRAVACNELDCAFSFRVLYLWNDEQTIRTDGIYKAYRRGSMFPLHEEPDYFERSGYGGNFHCASVPKRYHENCLPCAARLLHFGYIDREMRLRKWDWYNTIDFHNDVEDYYRHMIQGDVPARLCPYCSKRGLKHEILIPGEARLRHAGPLRLEALQGR